MTIALAVAVFAVGSVMAQVPAAAPYPAPGQLVDVGGYRVHLYCTGEGRPAVVIVGAGFSFDWALVRPEVAKFTRVCTYDVSGTAWSDAGPPLSCAGRLAEIHMALAKGAVKGPYVLVGLSIGGLSNCSMPASIPARLPGS